MEKSKLEAVKKLLYKQKPTAKLRSMGTSEYLYSTPLVDNDGGHCIVKFTVPVSDMGDASFDEEMDAHMLNRWITEVL